MHHFISPRARLILTYQLSDLHVASESRAAFRDFLPNMPAELVEQGGREVIFLDGIDLLKEDLDNERDLSFLSTDLPPDRLRAGDASKRHATATHPAEPWAGRR